MPELPEVETTRRGIEPHVLDRRVKGLTLRRADLRWPFPESLQQLVGARITAVERRAKYLLLHTRRGAALLHLGMSGSLRIVDAALPPRLHDHVDIVLDDGRALRFNDPRRFGALLWQVAGEVHPLLQALGPEPLGPDFSGDHLFALSRGKRSTVKVFLMDQAVVVGVGNIYAAESLFRAGIDPRREAGKVSLARYQRLADAVRDILAHAITRGGTTLRDFLNPEGEPGYFEQELQVYGREGLPCRVCGTPLRHTTLGQRATVWCARCQR
jgi:formamidopyrimidine-DNA glycosylase